MSGQVRVHAACGAASPRFAAGFAGSFHQLPQAVAPDPWVRTFVRACVGAAAALAALGLYAALRFSCRLASPRDARPTRLRLLLAAAPIGGAALSARLALLTPWLADRSAYAVCEGVEGGVASGHTWPIPGCLEDRTSRAWRSAHACVDDTWRGTARYAACALLLSLLGSACLATRLEERRER